MGLTAGVAIVNAAEVGAITGEAELASLEDAPSGVTIALIAVQATDWLRTRLRGLKSVDPDEILNQDELKEAAGCHVGHVLMRAHKDESFRERAETLRLQRDDAFKVFVPKLPEGDEQTVAEKGLSRLANQDAVPFFPPTDNTPPGCSSPGPWITK